MLQFRNGDRVFASIDGQKIQGDASLEINILLEETVKEILHRLTAEETLHCNFVYKDYEIPDILRDKLEGKPLLVFIGLHEDHISFRIKMARYENYPKFEIKRLDKHGQKVEIFAHNSEARDMLIHMMGNGARAIFTLHTDGATSLPYMTSEARPGSRTPSENYQVEFTTLEGNPDRLTCSRDELLDVISDPTKLNLAILEI